MRNTWAKRGPESVWQHFFETNPWIFGYGLEYVFLTQLDGKKLEQVTTGFQVDQRGKRTDALMKTSGLISSLCFCEIKTPETELLGKESSYRPGCWSISTDLAGSIAQIQQTVTRSFGERNDVSMLRIVMGTQQAKRFGFTRQGHLL